MLNLFYIIVRFTATGTAELFEQKGETVIDALNALNEKLTKEKRNYIFLQITLVS